jgi:hypothetical protein
MPIILRLPMSHSLPIGRLTSATNLEKTMFMHSLSDCVTLDLEDVC